MVISLRKNCVVEPLNIMTGAALVRAKVELEVYPPHSPIVSVLKRYIGKTVKPEATINDRVNVLGSDPANGKMANVWLEIIG